MNKNDYTNPYGVWSVSTEKDDEGREMKDLGMYEGRIDEIAFALSDKVACSLLFTKMNLSAPATAKPRKYVNITLASESGTWNMTPAERAAFVQNMLGNVENIHVQEAQIYGSVCLRRDDPTEAIRAAALAKLTPEEKAALGLN